MAKVTVLSVMTLMASAKTVTNLWLTPRLMILTFVVTLVKLMDNGKRVSTHVFTVITKSFKLCVNGKDFLKLLIPLLSAFLLNVDNPQNSFNEYSDQISLFNTSFR